MRKIDEIIIHCTATREGKELHASDIDRMHKAKGWQCIGYHYLITLDGTVEKGRDEEVTGAHTVGHNTRSIGVCYVGGLDCKGKVKDTRTFEQEQAMYKLCCELVARYPNVKLSGHNQWAAKACPCFDVPKWAAFRGLPYDPTIKRV